MKRILIVASYSAPYGGNFAASIITLAKRLREYQVDAFFAFPEDTKSFEWTELIKKEFPVVYIHKQMNMLDFNVINDLKSIISKYSISAVYSHFTGYDLSCFIAARKQKLILHMHNPINESELHSKVKLLKSKIKWNLFNRKVYIIACAEHLLSYLSMFGFDTTTSGYVLNGIDIDRILSKKSENPHQYPDDGLKVLMHGWDPYRKGVDTAIQACFKTTHKTYLYITYVDIVPVKNFIESQCGGIIPNNVILLPAVENIMDYLEGVDVFISPSRAEGSPYSLMEAIMAGKSSVGTNLPGLDWQKEIPALWTIDINDSKELGNILDKITITDKTQLQSKINSSVQIIKKKHSVDNWTDEVIKYLIETVGILE